jgi:hypothetical protein
MQTDDTDNRVYLYQISRDSGMPNKLADLVIMTLTHSNGNVKIQGHLTNYFKVKKGTYDNSAESCFWTKH